LNYFQAQDLLTAVKHGRPTTLKEINLALFLTGDLCGSLCEDGNESWCDRPCTLYGQGLGKRANTIVDRTWQAGSHANQGDQRC